MWWSVWQPRVGGISTGPRPPPSSLCGWKVPESLRSCSGQLSRPACRLHGDRREDGTPQSPRAGGRGSVSSPQGPQVWTLRRAGPHLSWGCLRDWLGRRRHLGVVALYSAFGGCCPTCSGAGPQTSGHTSHSDRQVQSGPGYPSCTPPAGPAPPRPPLDLTASSSQNPRATQQWGAGDRLLGERWGPWAPATPSCWLVPKLVHTPAKGGRVGTGDRAGAAPRDRASYTLVFAQDPGAGPVPASAQREGLALLRPLGPSLLWAGHPAPHRHPPHARSWWPHWAGQGWLDRGSPCGPGLRRLLGAAAPPPPGLTPHTWRLPGTVASGHTLAPAPAVPGPSPPQCPKTPWLHLRLLGAPPSSPPFTPDGRPPDPIRDGHRHLTGQHWMVPGL